MGKKTGSGGGRLWRADWLVGLGISLAVLFLSQSTDLFSVLERRFFDFGSTSTSRQPSDKVVILAIDDQSIANIGRWPWPRDVHAKLIDKLAEAKAKTIVNTTFFFEPQTDRGLKYIGDIKQTVASAPPGDALAERLTALISGAEKALDTDGALAVSLKQSGNVVLPAVFENGELAGNPDAQLPDFALRFGMLASAQSFMEVRSPQLPLPAFGDAAFAIGHLSQRLDPADGYVRSDPLFVNFAGQLVPSVSLVTASHSLNLPVDSFKFEGQGGFRLGGIRVPLDGGGFVYPQFYRERDGRPAFVTDSVWDVYSGKIPASKYAGKIVLIGATAKGVGEQFATPASLATTPAALLAHTTSSILSEHFYDAPEWGASAGLGVSVLMMFFLMFGLPRIGSTLAAASTAGLVSILAIVEYLVLTRYFIWVPLVVPMAVLVLGYLGLTTKRFVVTEAGKQKSDEESAETNRMMGLALQGQGQLDMAFDRFRRVPLSDAVMDNLMNLALDFERKRQFNKAQAVYEHMASFDKSFKDLQVKLKRVKSLSETVMLGGGATHPGGTLLLDAGDVQKPMLGRYQVEKELGKGAMGVVYLGKDPKIGRVVAIKTMALSQEFEGEELDDARQRFFREAETAGRLQHQNIVTIFDAGEDHELAYIAMEFLKGKDLVEHSRSGKLLPIETVVTICSKVADALAYAHTLNVVHRDIKPANIMYEPESGSVKVTDFGIARVTDASRTRTGMVLGTPSFMSPEQIAGKKVGGQSDLYSLGVMLFQMLTGVLPFRGESMAELMFKIANSEPSDLVALRPEISPRLVAIVARALAKPLDQRYATGSEMAADLRSCLETMNVASGPGTDHQNTVSQGQEVDMPIEVVSVPPGGGIGPADDAFVTTSIMNPSDALAAERPSAPQKGDE